MDDEYFIKALFTHGCNVTRSQLESKAATVSAYDAMFCVQDSMMI